MYTNDHPSLGKLTVTVLAGLLRHGRNKTFSQILSEDNIHLAPQEYVQLAEKLKSYGFIVAITDHLDGIRASITAFGEQVASFVPAFGSSVLRALNRVQAAGSQ